MHIYEYTKTFIHVNIYTNILAYSFTHIRTQVHVNICAFIEILPHMAYTHITYIDMPTYIHILIYIYIQI